MQIFLPRGLATVLLSAVVAQDALAQSTTASVSGTVYDQQRGVLPGAALSLKNLETGQVRSTVSDATGNFRLLGIAPGPHLLAVELAGFARHLSEITLSISQEAEINPVMKLAPVGEQVTVAAQPALAESSTTTLSRTFETKEIEELPVAARDFASLAVLTPGILTNHNARGVVTGIASAAQNGRNNTFLIDGLTLDDHVFATTRGAVSLDAIKEFMVLSNHFTAEYGQASGAVVSVLTRSGTNRHSGRGFYFHRDDKWDATAGAVKLTVPPADKSELEQKVVGGFLGGPIKPNRAFFFGSIEHTMRDTESIVTSGVQRVFLPGAPPRLPVEARSSQVLARSDINPRQHNMLTLRYRFERAELTNQTNDPGPVGLISAERRADEKRRDQDLAVVDNHVIGSAALNEFRFQFARREIDNDVTRYCADCWAENRPGILLGKSSVVPSPRTEDRWQFANAVTYLVADKLGDHAFKAGVDLSLVAVDAMRTAGHDGIFTFDTNDPFDPTRADTYPTRYFRSEGDLFVDASSRLYTAFFQDHWKPVPRLTLNLGVRWDYEEAIGVARDRDNVAPRMGIAFDPWKDGRTSIRGGYGVVLRPRALQCTAQCGERRQGRADHHQISRLSRSARAQPPRSCGVTARSPEHAAVRGQDEDTLYRAGQFWRPTHARQARDHRRCRVGPRTQFAEDTQHQQSRYGREASGSELSADQREGDRGTVLVQGTSGWAPEAPLPPPFVCDRLHALRFRARHGGLGLHCAGCEKLRRGAWTEFERCPAPPV